MNKGAVVERPDHMTSKLEHPSVTADRDCKKPDYIRGFLGQSYFSDLLKTIPGHTSVIADRVRRKLPYIREALGQSYFSDLIFFFRNIILSGAYDVKVFISRRAYVLMRMFAAILDISEDEIKGTLICDNAIPFYKGKNGEGLIGKDVLVVDDLLLQGNSLYQKMKLLSDYGATKTNYMVFAKNIDSQSEREKKLRKNIGTGRDKDLSDFFEKVFASHTLNTGEIDILGERIVDSIGACNFPYLSFLPAFILDGKQDRFPVAIPGRFTCFEDLYDSYIYSKQQQQVKIIALESGAFYTEDSVSDAFIRHYISDDTISLVPFSILSEKILYDENKLRMIYRELMGRETPHTTQEVYSHALEGTSKLLTYLLSLALVKRCIAPLNKDTWSNFCSECLDLEGMNYGFGEDIGKDILKYAEEPWLLSFIREDRHETLCDISDVVEKRADKTVYRQALERFAEEFQVIKVGDDTGKDAGCFHQRVADPAGDSAKRTANAAALVAELDAGRVTYILRYKDGALRAVLTPGERARNYCPELLFPVLCVERYYKTRYSAYSQTYWTKFKEWYIKYINSFHSDENPLSEDYKYINRFHSDENPLSEDYLNKWVISANERPALFSRDNAYRCWHRNDYFDKVLTEGFAIPQIKES